MKKHSTTGGRANWTGAAFELRLGVKFCVDILLGDAAGLDAGAPRLIQLQAPAPVDDLVVEFENGSHWAIQAKAGRSVRVDWNPNRPFGKALRQLYEGATSGQISLSPASSDRVELAVDHQAHNSIIAFSEWVDKARHHHSWESFATASTGVEREWVKRLPSFLGIKPNDDLLAFLKKLFVHRAPAPDEWWSNLRGRLVGVGIPNNETADQILDIILAQVATAARYAGQLNRADLCRVCQITTSAVSSSSFALLKAQPGLAPSNLRQALAPLAPYAVRLSIIALILQPPLVFLALKWYFSPPDTVMEGLAWIVPTIGIWAAFLANLAQFTGFSLRDIWRRADLQARWIKMAVATDLILGIILLIAIASIIMQWPNPAEQQRQSAHPDRILILVAEFSEGASYEVPPDRTITHKILGGLEELSTRDPRIVVVELGQVILDPDNATRLGRERNAIAVIWGTYTPSPTSVLVEPHLKLVSPSVAMFAEGYLTEPEERAVDIEALHSFALHLELRQEMAYLSSFVAGLAHYWDKRYDEALADFDMAFEFAIGSESLGAESVYYYQGLILRQQGEYAKAEKQFKEAIVINPRFANAYNGLGLTYRAQNRTDEAIAQYLEAIDIDSQFAYAYNNLAVAYGVQGRPVEDRIELYLKALELDPDNFLFHQNLGLLYEDLGRYDEALVEYLSAVRANPYVADSWYYLASLYYDLARWEEAKVACQKALELDSNHAAAHNLLGIIYAGTGYPKQAVAEYKAALEINPHFASAHCNLGLYYESQRKPEQAQAEYEEAVGLDPDEPVYYCRLGSLYTERGQLEKGENLLAECERLVAVNSDDPGGHNALGMAYFALGEYSQAVQEFQRAVQLDPEYHTYHSNLSSAYEELGQIQKAMEEAEAALRLTPNPFESHSKLLRLRWTTGDYGGVIRELALTARTAPLSVASTFALDLTVGLVGFLGIAYLLYVLCLLFVLKDAKRSGKAVRPAGNALLSCIVAARWALMRVDAHIQKAKRRSVRLSVAPALGKINRFLAATYYSLANISLLNDQQERALNELQRALDADPAYTSAAHQLVNFYAASDNLATACRFARQAIKASPHDAAMHTKLGDILWGWNMIGEAIREWEEAIETNADAVVSYRLNNLHFDPLYIPAHFTLGLAFEAQGEIGKSLISFKATISSTHNHILKLISERKIQTLQAEEAGR